MSDKFNKLKEFFSTYNNATNEALDDIKRTQEQSEENLLAGEADQSGFVNNKDIPEETKKNILQGQYFKKTTPNQPLLSAVDKDVSKFLLNKQRYGDLNDKSVGKFIDRHDINSRLAEKFVKEADPSFSNNMKFHPDLKDEKLKRMVDLSRKYIEGAKNPEVSIKDAGKLKIEDMPVLGRINEKMNMDLDRNAPLNVPFHELLHTVYPPTANENTNNLAGSKDIMTSLKINQNRHIPNAETIKRDLGTDIGDVGESYELVKALLKAKNKK